MSPEGQYLSRKHSENKKIHFFAVRKIQYIVNFNNITILMPQGYNSQELSTVLLNRCSVVLSNPRTSSLKDTSKTID